jgi:hypothetical protein
MIEVDAGLYIKKGYRKRKNPNSKCKAKKQMQNKETSAKQRNKQNNV